MLFMKKIIFHLFILFSVEMMAQQTLEKGINLLNLTGATKNNNSITITGTDNIQNNKATSSSETVLEEMDMVCSIQVSSFDKNSTFRYGIGKQSNLAGTYIELTGDSIQSKIIVNRMDASSASPIIAVKEYALPFKINPGETYQIRLGKRIRYLIVELDNGKNHFLTDTLKYPSPFFGLAWGTPFIACSTGTISISDYELSTPFNLSPRLAVWGDSFIEGSSLDDAQQRYISYLKDSIGYENIAIMGKGGENSTSMNNRFNAEINWFKDARYALVAIGVNDLSFNTWKTNMLNYIGQLKAKGIVPIIATLTPREDRNAFIIEANKWIRTTYNGAFVDINRVVATDDINWIPGSYMPDKIHPKAEAHRAIFYRIAEEAPYLFRNDKSFTIDYLNETTIQPVINTMQYSYSSDLSGAQPGSGNPIELIPGKDLYFKNTNVNNAPVYDILIVPERPAPPLTTGPNVTVGIFNWINTPGFEQTDNYEYSTDEGNTWVSCSEKPIHNSSVTALDVRVKASTKNFKSIALHIDHLTAIAKQELDNITIYPNPIKNKLMIDNVAMGSAHAFIYASDGQLVKPVKLESGLNTVNLENLPKGVYMLIMVDHETVRNLKLVKTD